MDWFLLQPGSVLALTQVLLLFVVTSYLLSIKTKARSTWLLALVFGLLGLTWFQIFLDSVYIDMPVNIDSVDDLAIPLIVYLLLHFAYAFIYNPFGRESRFVLWGVGLFIGFNTIYQAQRFVAFTLMSNSYVMGIEIGNFLMLLVGLSIYLRKRARLSKGLDDLPADRQAGAETRKAQQALRAFALLTAGMLLLSLRGIWVAVLDLWPSLGTPSPFIAMINLPIMVVLFLLFVVVYINHMPQPTTFQIKIIGFSLATLLAVLGIADLLLFSEADLRREGRVLLPDHQTLRFEPDDQGGYRAAHVPFQFDPDLGDNLNMGAESDSLVTLDFAFPFDGRTWQEMYIDANGLVAFGSPYLPRHFDGFFSDEQPKIAPYYRSLVPGVTGQSGVYYKREPDKVTVTWFLMWESLSSIAINRNTVQLVLHERGAIDFVYERVEAPFNGRGDGMRGLRPGGAAPPLEPVRFSNLYPEIVTAGTLPGGRSVRFEPTGDGDYRRTAIPFRFDPDLGEDLGLGDDDNARITLDFSFPFYESRWPEAYVSANGAVAFGGPINPPDSVFYRPLRDFYNERPKIAPLFIDLNPAEGGRVFHKREAGKSTITWHEVPRFGTSVTCSIQLVLHDGGAIDFIYNWIGVPLYAVDLWGLYPGDARPRTHAAHYLFDFLAYEAAPGTILVEDFNLVYRRFVHAQIVPLAYVVVASTLFILIVFPFFFRTSLIKPLRALLQGVRRVDTGNLDTPVPIRVNDEIGILAQNFNRMTTSLKTAEEQLKAYAEGLEQKVAERTEDLQTALRHLTETQDQLIHAEKMASLGQLTAGIAHEIKNPLNFINNFSQLSVELADDLVAELEAHPQRSLPETLDAVQELLDDLRQNAEKVREHGRRADGIVRSMLEHSRGGAGERRPVEMNGLVEEYVKLAYHGMRAASPDFNVTIERDYDEAVGTVEMMPQEIGRVFINLLNNAFHAVQQKADGSDAIYAPTVSVSTQRIDGQVRIEVADNGSGIAEADRGRIFEPFFTTKPTGEGTGLGLSLSYDIVTQGHGGTMEVESTEGEGATFILTLPV